MEQTDQLEISALMVRYFDGLYNCDTAILRTVFHERLSYVNANPGQQEFLTLEPYLKRIEERSSPASLNEPREDSIDKIETKGGQMGMVEARTTMWKRDYTDLLTIIRSDDGWRVLNKIFTYVEREG